MHIVPNVLPQSLCVWPRKSMHVLVERQNHTIVRSAYLCHMISEESIILPFLYIKLFELGVEIAFNDGPAVSHNKFNLFKFLLQSSCAERTDDAFVLLICFCFFNF